MARKTVKDLEGEICDLKKQLNDNDFKYETLQKKYDSLERKVDSYFAKKNLFKCDKCMKEFASLRDLRSHNTEHKSKNDLFQCNHCERCFNEEWKLSAHVKTHVKYPCDLCDKTFKFQEIKLKHIQISHENLKIYCHFFNKKKECPHNDDCIYLHEESIPCKYERFCEGEYCMFKHEVVKDDKVKVIESKKK